MSFRAPAVKCFVCNKSVYAVELIKADGRDFHQNCLKCTHCNRTLKLGNFASLSGKYYCKPHFKQLFALKGNYHSGFEGASDPKSKWLEGGEEGAADSPLVDASAGKSLQRSVSWRGPSTSAKPSPTARSSELISKEQSSPSAGESTPISSESPQPGGGSMIARPTQPRVAPPKGGSVIMKAAVFSGAAPPEASEPKTAPPERRAPIGRSVSFYQSKSVFEGGKLPEENPPTIQSAPITPVTKPSPSPAPSGPKELEIKKKGRFSINFLRKKKDKEEAASPAPASPKESEEDISRLRKRPLPSPASAKGDTDQDAIAKKRPVPKPRPAPPPELAPLPPKQELPPVQEQEEQPAWEIAQPSGDGEDIKDAEDLFAQLQKEEEEEAARKAEQEKAESEVAREEAERKKKEETERKAREEAERKKAREEAERKKKEEADRKAREEAERKKKEETERKAREEAERKKKEELDRKRRAEAEKKREEDARRKREEEERQRKAEEEKAAQQAPGLFSNSSNPLFGEEEAETTSKPSVSLFDSNHSNGVSAEEDEELTKMEQLVCDAFYELLKNKAKRAKALERAKVSSF